MLDEQVVDAERRDQAASSAPDDEDEPYDDRARLEPTTRCIVVRAVETQDRPRAHAPHRRGAVRRRTSTAQFIRVHAQLVELAGTPPFTCALGDHEEEALSFEALRTAVLDVARKGVTVQRFKGLGEMNADQLAETTMDPATRTLAQVEVDDAAEADRTLLDAHGRPGRAAPRVHRGQRPPRRQPGRLGR